MLCFVCLFCSCTKKQTIQYDTQLDFPSSLVKYSFGDNEYKGIDSRTKIVAVYDSLVCGPCSVNRLIMWKDVLEFVDNNKERVSLVIIFSPKRDEYSYIEEAISSNPIDYPIYLDRDNLFLKSNKVSKGISVCLLDSCNNVILRGMPIGNDALWNHYKDLIINDEHI